MKIEIILKEKSLNLSFLKKHLKFIGRGSGRGVFIIDNKRVLKFAYNEGGISQNKVEISLSNNPKYSKILAEVCQYDEEYKWIIVERAVPLKCKDFYSYTKIRFTKFRAGMLNFLDERDIENNSYFKLVQELMNEFKMPKGDLIKNSSWGIVERTGEKIPVLIDYGLIYENYKQFYSR